VFSRLYVFWIIVVQKTTRGHMLMIDLGQLGAARSWRSDHQGCVV
jgi:hypothetical protein